MRKYLHQFYNTTKHTIHTLHRSLISQPLPTPPPPSHHNYQLYTDITLPYFCIYHHHHYPPYLFTYLLYLCLEEDVCEVSVSEMRSSVQEQEARQSNTSWTRACRVSREHHERPRQHTPPSAAAATSHEITDSKIFIHTHTRSTRYKIGGPELMW